ncbi:hypothetical protein BD779DRAFT_1469655 [Infundibulicybe gibba]|nr:hypothetical protein BD779DRAFT_1469655 [Infundibulicybe gibba]
MTFCVTSVFVFVLVALTGFTAATTTAVTVTATFAGKFRKLVEGRFKRYGHFEYDTEGEIIRYRALATGKPMLVEGANTLMLDLGFGTYPFITSPSTTAGCAQASEFHPAWLDVLDTLSEIKVAIKYLVDGKELPGFHCRRATPRLLIHVTADLTRAEIEYSYVLFTENFLGVPVEWIGVGPGRESTLRKRSSRGSRVEYIAINVALTVIKSACGSVSSVPAARVTASPQKRQGSEHAVTPRYGAVWCRTKLSRQRGSPSARAPSPSLENLGRRALGTLPGNPNVGIQVTQSCRISKISGTSIGPEQSQQT